MSDRGSTTTERSPADAEHDSEANNAVDHIATGPDYPQRDTASSSVTFSADQRDEVTDRNDGYEYHKTTATDHELRGSDLRDSVLVGAQGDGKLVGGDGEHVLVAGSESNRGVNHLNGGSGDGNSVTLVDVDVENLTEANLAWIG